MQTRIKCRPEAGAAFTLTPTLRSSPANATVDCRKWTACRSLRRTHRRSGGIAIDLLSADGWNYSEMINACLSRREARAISIRRRAPHARRGAAKIALS
jgi:hypothetical protein